jgi:hypothetical protein
MSLLPYSTVFNRVYGKIDDPRELSLDESYLTEIYTERLHNAAGNPRVRRLFSSLSLDDETQRITYELNYSVDEFADEEFILDILSLGIIIEWLKPKVDSLNYTILAIGGSKEKVLVNNYKNMSDRLDSLGKEQSKLIRDYGYMYNSYVNGGD